MATRKYNFRHLSEEQLDCIAQEYPNAVETATITVRRPVYRVLAMLAECGVKMPDGISLSAEKYAHPEDAYTTEIQAQPASPFPSSKDDKIPMANQPRVITVKMVDGKNDWETFAGDWERVLPLMTDAQSVEKLRSMNEKNLDALKRENPPKATWCWEKLSERMAQLGGVEETA